VIVASWVLCFADGLDIDPDRAERTTEGPGDVANQRTVEGQTVIRQVPNELAPLSQVVVRHFWEMGTLPRR
jgi:hypothetical protein